MEANIYPKLVLPTLSSIWQLSIETHFRGPGGGPKTSFFCKPSPGRVPGGGLGQTLAHFEAVWVPIGVQFGAILTTFWEPVSRQNLGPFRFDFGRGRRKRSAPPLPPP